MDRQERDPDLLSLCFPSSLDLITMSVFTRAFEQRKTAYIFKLFILFSSICFLYLSLSHSNPVVSLRSFHLDPGTFQLILFLSTTFLISRANEHCYILAKLFYFGRILFFFNFWLRWVFVAARGLSLVAARGGYSLLRCGSFLLRWLLLLRSTDSRRVGFSSCGSRALERRLSSYGAQA